MTAKNVREKIGFLKQELGVPEERLARRLKRIPIPEYAIRFALGLLLAKTAVFERISPFGTAFVAASPMGLAGIATLAGVLLGYVISPVDVIPLKYLAQTVLVAAVRYFCRDTILTEKKWFAPLTAVVTALGIGCVYVIDAQWTGEAAVLYFTDVILSGGCTYFYETALSNWDSSDSQAETRHAVSILVLVITALAALEPLKLFGMISIGRTVAVVIVMLASFRGGTSYGCSAACAAGLLMDAASKENPYFTLLYGFCALTAGVFAKYGRVTFLASYIVADCAAVLWMWAKMPTPAAMFEVFLASILVAVLPSGVIARLTVLIPANVRGYGALKAREYARTRVEQASGAFRDLYETVRAVMLEARNDESVTTVFEAAAENVCKKCKCWPACWQADHTNTKDVMNHLTPLLYQRGVLRPGDFPADFSDSCAHLPEYAAAVTAEYRSMQVRRRYRAKLSENRIAAFGQYADFSRVLAGISAELGSDIGFDQEIERKIQKLLRLDDIDGSVSVFRDRGGRLHAEITGSGLYPLRKDVSFLTRLSAAAGVRLCCAEQRSGASRLLLLEAEPLAATVGIASLRKKGQASCGDNGTYFKTDEGILYILLSDGMGSGQEASRVSTDAVRILEKFLRSGVSPELAMRILNDQMLLRNTSDTVSATVDLMSVNLFTGETKIFKYGAAPTYVCRGDTVRKLKSHSLAAGLASHEDGAPEVIRLKLEPGNVAVVLTDGITAGGDEWLRKKLGESAGENARELARELLEESIPHAGRDDDMTVITLFLCARA